MSIEISPPTSFSFGSATVISPVNLLPTGFITTSDAFTGTSGLTVIPIGTAGTVAASGGQCTVTHSGVKAEIIAETSSAFTLPQAFVQITIDVTGTETTVYDVCGVGFFKDASNYLMASYDRINHEYRFELEIAGSHSFIGAVTASYGSSFKLGLSLVMNSVTAYVDTGSGWTSPTGTNVGGTHDFTASGALTGWNAGFYVANGGTGTTWKFSGFKGGYFGTVATKDMAVVTNKDGSAYMTGTVATFTADCIDGGGEDYVGIFTLDLSNNTLTQTGGVLTTRGGTTRNDVGAHIMYDSATGTYTFTAASWPTLATQLGVVYGTTTTNILSGFHTVAVSLLTLPGLSTGYGSYDPMLCWDGAKYLLAYTIVSNTSFSGNPFYAALASSTDLSTWTLIGADTGHTGYEGTKLVKDNGAYYVTVGGPAISGNSSRVYDSAMSFIGSLSATFDGSSHTQPHAMVFGAGSTEYLVTFDGVKWDTANGTWGNWWIETATRFTGTTVRPQIFVTT